MSIASAITAAQGKIANAYTAISEKGGTLPATQNLSNIPTAISSIPSGGGSGTTNVELTRFKDDTNIEIGTHYMNFEDGSGNVFKIILLDAQYRNSSTYWCSSHNTVTNMPLYYNLASSNVWEASETATTNTQLILDYCTAGGYTSTACSHCRSKLFTIGGTIYYGQLPNFLEVSYIARNYNSFDAMDTSASSQSSLNFLSARAIWSSNQYSTGYSWSLGTSGLMNGGANKSATLLFACPVLEIPA